MEIANKIEKNKGLTYLSALIPRGTTQTQLLTEVAVQLNEMKIVPKVGRAYNFGIVQNIWYGRYNDEKVEQLLKSKLKYQEPCQTTYSKSTNA